MRPKGQISQAAEPEEYDVDEAEANVTPVAVSDRADLAAALSATNVLEVLDQLDREPIALLLQVMEAERDKLVVIFAGYKDRMDEFFRSNPGLSSRVAHHIDFPDYDVDELMEIAHLMMGLQNYVFGPGAEEVFREYL